MFHLNQEVLLRKFDILKSGVIDLYEKLIEDENDPKSETSKVKRTQAQKNFSKKGDENIPFDESKESSMKDSQGKGGFSGTSYNGPGKVRQEKTDTNKLQRNYRNHQGNK